jgi:hypothetical protein
MASIPTNGYAEVMAGTNNYTGSNSYDASCPKTAIIPVAGDDLCNKTYVDAAAGGGLIGSLTDKGSLITANGTTAVIFDQNPYQSALTTTTVYDWNSLAVAQSRNFTTTAPTSLPLGASITITYSGTDSITGTVTAIVGTTVTLTITALAHATYTPAVLLNTAAATTYASGLLINPLPYINVDTTPNPPEIQANSIITQGELFFYSPTGQTVTITIGGTSIQRATSTAGVMPVQPAFAPPPPAVPTALFWNGANGGCFVGATQEVGINVAYSAGAQPTWGFLPNAPTFQAFFIGSLTGYTLSYNTGSITITGDIALLADPVSSTGLKWGVVSGGGGGGTVNSVIGGTNIIMSGTSTAPVVNLRDPLTAQLNCGTQSIIDRNGSSGSSGQVLTAGTGSQVLWGANGVSSITATPFANITINNTVPSAPTIGVSNPCNATLALGVQNLTAVNGFDSSTINANGIDTTYLQAGVAGANADLNTNLGNAQLFMSSSDLAGGTSHLLQMVCPLTIGNADILHTTVGATKRNMDIATEGSLGISAGITTVVSPPTGSNTGITINSGGLAGNTLPTTFKNSNAGNIANPIMKLENTNATGSVALECYKNKPTAAVNGDVLFTQSVFGKDSGNAKQEYTRINHSVRDTTAGVEDGSIEFGCFVNGAINTFLQINGNENEVNCLRVLDMAGNNIRTNTGNLTLDATTSTGSGIINLNPKTGTGYVAINNASASNLRLDGTIHNLTAPTKNSIDMAVNPSALFPINGFTINRNLVKLDYQDGVSNDVSVISLENDPSAGGSQFDASYLTGSTGALQQTFISTSPASHSIQLLDPTAGLSTKIFPTKIELDKGNSDITIDAGAFTSGVQMSGGGNDGIESGSFIIQGAAGTQEFRLVGTDIATSQSKTLSIDNNTAADGIISYTNNTGDGAELQITSNTDLSIGTVSGTGNSVFINAQNEATVSSQNQLSLKVGTASQPITFEVANSGGFLNFVGTDLQSTSSGGLSGQFLSITLNGNQYKIELFNP